MLSMETGDHDDDGGRQWAQGVVPARQREPLAVRLDEIRFNTRVIGGYLLFSRIVGWVLLGTSIVALPLWLFGPGPLCETFASPALPRAGAWLGLLLSGAALLLIGKRPRVSLALSCALLLLALMEAMHHLRGWRAPDIGCWANAPGQPGGHMTELATICFLLLALLGIAIAMRRAVLARDLCAFTIIGFAMASAASYGLELAGEQAPLLTLLPLTTAGLVLLATLAWLASTPTTGLTRISVADSIGGAFARRLILPTLALPIALTYLFEGLRILAGLSEAMALSLASVCTGGMATVMILWVSFLMDASERQRRAAIALHEQASIDALTGLANRRTLDSRLATALAQSADDVVLLMLDIDFFKRFNDSFGHQAGDDVLRETGRLLRAAVRDKDLAARYGGEEFAVVLAGADCTRARQVGERILLTFRSFPWPLRAVTISIGGARAAPSDTPETLIQRADAALYASKQAGRDRLTLADAPVDAARPEG